MSIPLSVFSGRRLADVETSPQRRAPPADGKGRIAELEAKIESLSLLAAECHQKMLAAQAENQKLCTFVADGMKRLESEAETKAGPERAAREAAEAECCALRQQVIERDETITRLTGELATEKAARSSAEAAMRSVPPKSGQSNAPRNTITGQPASPLRGTEVSGKRNYNVVVLERDGNGFGQRFSITSG